MEEKVLRKQCEFFFNKETSENFTYFSTFRERKRK